MTVAMDDVRARQGTAGDGAAPGGSPADDATEEMPAIGPEAGRPFPLGCRPEDDGCPDGNLPGYAGSEDFRRFEEANPWLGGSDARSQCGTMCLQHRHGRLERADALFRPKGDLVFRFQRRRRQDLLLC